MTMVVRLEDRKEFKRVVVSGYYGSGNFGDQAMLQRLIDVIGEAGVEHRTTVVSHTPFTSVGGHPVTTVSADSKWQRLSAIAQSDALIFGGGELIKDYGNGEGPAIGLALFDVLVAALFGVPTVIYQVGAEQISSRRSQWYVGRALSCCDAIFTRDSVSLSRLKACGVPHRLLHEGTDILFGLNDIPRHLHAADAPTPAHPSVVALSLPDLEMRKAAFEYPERLRAFLGGLVEGFAMLSSHQKVRLVLVGFQSVERAKDLDLLRTIGERLKARMDVEEVLISEEDVYTALQRFHSFDFVVGMRFHSIILAVLAGVPFLPLSLEDKVWKLARELDIEPWCFDLVRNHPLQLVKHMDFVWQTREELLRRVREQYPVLQAKAYASERYLIRVLESSRRGHRHTGRALRTLFRLLWDGSQSYTGRNTHRSPWHNYRWGVDA